jgi:O-antigen ligase
VRGKNIKISIINITGIILNLYIISFITISKSGFIIYLLSFVIYFFFSYKLNDKKNINKFIYTIVILLIFFILIQFNIINLNYLKMRYFGYDINRFNDPLLYITSGRSNTWLSGIIGFLKRPIMGVGSSDLIEMDFLMRINATYSVSHNLYISLLVQYGIIGFFIFSAIIYETFKDINLYIKYNLFLLVPVIILILLLLSGLSLSWVKREIVWIFIGIVNGMKFKTKKII